MVKKTLGYVELEWPCPGCGTRNPGSARICASCGAAQPDKVAFQQAAEEKLVTDKDEIVRAKAGPDVHCAFCGTRNPAGAEKCTQCGADLSSATARKSGQVLGAFRDGAAKKVPCPSCGALNHPNAFKCSQCNAALPRKERPKPSPKPRQRAAARGQEAKPARKGLKIAILAGAAFVLLACILLVIITNPWRNTEEATGVVQGLSWSRSIEIEALRDVSHEGWRDKVPAGASLGRCTKKHHHTQGEPAPGAEEVCGTPYTVDKGSGYGEVVQDCQYKVYADWCTYTTQEWAKVDTLTLDGTDAFPRWPNPALNAQQRAGDREQSYQVLFEIGERTVTYRTSDPDSFARFQVGDRWRLEVNARGGARVIEPAP